MAALPVLAYVLFKNTPLFIGKSPSEESFPYVFHCLRGRMTHVFCIEPIVSQLVHNYLICREIVCTSVNGGVYSKKQSGLAQLIAVGSILEMSDRAYCKDVFFRTAA